MASSLIGISVAVTLQNPPNTVVQGTVASVNSQTATLTLQNGRLPDDFYSSFILIRTQVFFPASGHRLNSYHVEGHAIADIKVNVAYPTAVQPCSIPAVSFDPYATTCAKSRSACSASCSSAIDPACEPADSTTRPAYSSTAGTLRRPCYSEHGQAHLYCYFIESARSCTASRSPCHPDQARHRRQSAKECPHLYWPNQKTQ
jgi:hypothetical protein